MNQVTTISNDPNNAALLEKVITNNDLGGLTSLEKVKHIKNVCESLGLNPFTKPIQLIKFQGKEIAYFTKDATEQLRKNNNVSLKIRDTKIMEGIYVVIADAKLPDGREDSSTGATTIQGLKGDALCNAMLKAETKAKRRVTLSICGLGFTDESELETMKGSSKVEISNVTLDEDLIEISECVTLDELQEVYTTAYKYWIGTRDKDAITKLINAKDVKKQLLEAIENVD